MRGVLPPEYPSLPTQDIGGAQEQYTIYFSEYCTKRYSASLTMTYAHRANIDIEADPSTNAM
jgi:hypothetical protein